LVFRGGRIVECGSFEEPVAANGHFAELARSQFLVRAASPEQVEASRTAAAH
jgi:ATP-binding cassette, subfamily B, beta-glucan exporter